MLTGGQGDMQSETDHVYFRGMDGDRLNSDGGRKDVSVPDGESGSYPDHEALEGFELKTTVLDKASGKAVSKTITTR
ncbi:hypothetical protein ACIBHX_41450 [Nonomuraea sp. NPDC050536]|uniref:hypothetical protein n=1 Tax=Nonomuraea sp. NPDC050536 TaxID=3364366 RepID=UPI0037CC2240